MATPNIVPRAAGGGSLGTSAKGWGGLYATDITTSSANQGGVLQLAADDGAAMGDSHRLGVIYFKGAEDTSNTLTTGTRIEALTEAAWTNAENGAALYFYTTDGNASETNVFKLDSNKRAIFPQGKVGIGTSTPLTGTDSTLGLDIENTSASAAGEGGALRLGSNDGAPMGSGHRLGVIEFTGAEDASSTMTVGARIEALCDSTWADDENGADLLFYTTDGNASQSEQMRILATGNVGIGDNAPGTLLQMKSTAPYLTLHNSTAENTEGGAESKIIFEDHANAALAQIEASHSGTSDDTKGKFIVSTHTGSALTAALTIDDEQKTTLAQTLTTAATTPIGLLIDANYSGVAAQNSVGLHLDFDRTVAGSGTAAHNDIGINLDINSASLGASKLYGMDIDVVGATSGTSTAIGISLDVDGADDNLGMEINTAGTHLKLIANADVNDYATIALADTGDLTIATVGSGTTDSDFKLDIDGDIELDADGGDITFKDGGTALATIASLRTESFIIACSDETSLLTAGTAKATFRMPYAFTLTAVRASVNTAPTGSVLTVDINEGGSTILTTKLTIDISEKTSTSAATAAVIGGAGPALADDAEMTIDIDGIGSTVAGKGLKVYLIGYQTV